MEQLAYEDAVDVYGRALEVLELMDDPDESLRCSLLLSLGGAEAKSARVADARAAFERAAESARRLDDTDSLVGAAIGIAMMSEAGRLDEQLLALLDEALERIGPERTARRAALLSAKSAEMYWVDNDISESQQLVDEAIEIAREVEAPPGAGGRPAAEDLHPLRAGRPAGAAATRRRDARDRAGKLAIARPSFAAHAYRLWQFLELGDMEAVDRELATYARLADELRMPEHSWHVVAIAGHARPARRRHRGRRAAGRAGEARRASERSSRSHRSTYGIQMIQIRSLQGRAGELIPAVRDLAERFPGIPAWRGGLITLAARSGDVELARRQLDRFAGDDFSAIPRDVNWVVGDEPAGRGDRADRRHRARRARVRRAAPLRGAGDRRCPRDGHATARSTGCSGCSRRRWAASTTPSVTWPTSVEIATRMGDRPGMALCGLASRRAAARPTTVAGTATWHWSCSPTSSAQPARWARAGSWTAPCATGSRRRG